MAGVDFINGQREMDKVHSQATHFVSSGEEENM